MSKGKSGKTKALPTYKVPETELEAMEALRDKLMPGTTKTYFWRVILQLGMEKLQELRAAGKLPRLKFKG